MFSIWREELRDLRHTLGKPRHPVQIVATLRGLAFDETLLYNVPVLRVIVVTGNPGWLTLDLPKADVVLRKPFEVEGVLASIRPAARPLAAIG